MAIHFKCSACGGDHPSGIQMDEKSFADPSNVIGNNTEICPSTRKPVTTSKETMFWKEPPSNP